MLKLITYLSDVDDGAGPFGYLDRNASDRVVRNLQYWSGFISDAQLETVLPRDRWRAATGPALCTTFVDTCRLLHRATPPRATDRYSVTFSYCSQQPFQRFEELLPTADQVARLTEGMTERQQRAAAAAPPVDLTAGRQRRQRRVGVGAGAGAGGLGVTTFDGGAG